MPADRAPMRKIRNVLRLLYACGLSERRIALAIGLSRSIPPEIDDTTLERPLFPRIAMAQEATLPYQIGELER